MFRIAASVVVWLLIIDLGLYLATPYLVGPGFNQAIPLRQGGWLAFSVQPAGCCQSATSLYGRKAASEEPRVIFAYRMPGQSAHFFHITYVRLPILGIVFGGALLAASARQVQRLSRKNRRN